MTNKEKLEILKYVHTELCLIDVKGVQATKFGQILDLVGNLHNQIHKEINETEVQEKKAKAKRTKKENGEDKQWQDSTGDQLSQQA